MDIQTGVLGSLTPDQEARLQQLWMFLLNAFESAEMFDNNFSISNMSRRSNSIDEPPLSPSSFNTTFSSSRRSMSSGNNNYNNNFVPPSPTTPISPAFSPTAPTMSSELNVPKPQHQPSLRKLRHRTSLLSNNNKSFTEPNTPTMIPRRSSTRKGSLSFQTQSMGGVNLRPSPQNAKVMQRVLSSYKLSPDELRQGLLASLKQDHPDSMLLRFLRARKWDVGKAFVMLVAAVAWRTKKMHIDDNILPRGELYALKQLRSSDKDERRRGWEFMKQLRMGKNIIHGVDRAGRPIIDIRVRLHRAEDQSVEVLERYIVHTIESVKMLLRPPMVETAILIFDMTDFSMANMDYTPVKYIIKCLESFYPESVTRIILHKAPWFFSGIWKMIKTWMNDSLVSKVHFTKTLEDLERFIPRQNLPPDLGGIDDTYQYHYIEPDPHDRAENLPLDTHSPTRDFLLSQRQRIAEDLLEATRLWLQTVAMRDRIGTAVQEDRRAELIEELRLNFWKVDPFIRARCQLDREGIIVSDGIGTIDFYPHLRTFSMSSFDSATPAAVTTNESAEVGVGLGLLSPSSSTLGVDTNNGEYVNGAVPENSANGHKEAPTNNGVRPQSQLNAVNFLLDESDNNSHDDNDARDEIMQEYMDEDENYDEKAHDYNTPPEEDDKYNHQQHLHPSSNITRKQDNDIRSDISFNLDDLDEEEEDIEIHDAVTQKVSYPRGGGFVERAAVRVINVR